MALKKVTRKDIVAFEYEFFKTTSTLILGAFTLVAALAWNTAVTKILEHYLSLTPDSTLSWLLYAIIITILTVLVTHYVGRITKREEQKQEAQEKKEV